jgi:prepilin-type processing-associated H-X9-DG protein
MRQFPMGGLESIGPAWSAYILPFVEQQNLFDTLVFQESGPGQWAHPFPGLPRSQLHLRPNMIASEVLIPLFRCTSAANAEFLWNRSQQDGWVVDQRVPANYIACASGLWTNQEVFILSEPVRGRGGEFLYHLTHADGVIFVNSNVRIADVTDGLSNTLLIGEVVPEDHSNPPHREPRGTKDHWALGGDDPDVNVDWSEFHGSTAVPMNLFTQADVPQWLLNLDPRATSELSFGSRHPGGAQFVRCDGSVVFLAETIDLSVYSAMGTRARSEVFDSTSQ